MKDACRGCKMCSVHIELGEKSRTRERKQNQIMIVYNKLSEQLTNATTSTELRKKKTKSIYSMLFECVELYLMCSS